jgi:hypothetical protein
LLLSTVSHNVQVDTKGSGDREQWVKDKAEALFGTQHNDAATAATATATAEQEL